MARTLAVSSNRRDYRPGAVCPDCGRRHRTWRAVATCRWRDGLVWVAGEPPASQPCFAVVSFCPSGTTVTLWADRQEAEKRKGLIDRLACGGRCLGPPGHCLYVMAGRGEYVDR